MVVLWSESMGRADAKFLNNLGIRATRFNAESLRRFIEYPNLVAPDLNMSLNQALELLPPDQLYIGRSGIEHLLKMQFKQELTTNAIFNTRSGTCSLGAHLMKLRNYIRAYKTYVNRVENEPRYNDQEN